MIYVLIKKNCLNVKLCTILFIPLNSIFVSISIKECQLIKSLPAQMRMQEFKKKVMPMSIYRHDIFGQMNHHYFLYYF